MSLKLTPYQRTELAVLKAKAKNKHTGELVWIMSTDPDEFGIGRSRKLLGLRCLHDENVPAGVIMLATPKGNHGTKVLSRM